VSRNFGLSYNGGELKTVTGKKSLRDDTLSGSLSLDTSVIIELLPSSQLGRAVMEALIADSVEAHTSEVNLAEAEYVLCRRLGHDTSKSKVNNLRNSGYAVAADTEQVSRIAAQIKCKRALSLADCYTLATAKATASKALFAFREKDLDREMKRHPYEVEVIFLEDLVRAEDPRRE
jgi:predicted nucleic acid-binding protein